MKIIKPSIEFIWMTEQPLIEIERAARTCYKSEDRISEGSAENLVKRLIMLGHEAMLEHASISYKVICDRGVTHEIVRHRLFSFAQESTRYVNYKGKDIEFIKPCFLDFEHKAPESVRWKQAMDYCEKMYNEMIACGCSPQKARSVLPNSLKTEIIMTGNLRQWRHFFKLRLDRAAHPQMREIASILLYDIVTRVPLVFNEYKFKTLEDLNENR